MSTFAEKIIIMSIKAVKDRIKRSLQCIPEDKRLHFYIGFAVSAVVSTVFGYIIGVIASVVAGVGKEAYDKVTKRGTPELLDFAFTVTGALVFVLFSVLLSRLVEELLLANL